MRAPSPATSWRLTVLAAGLIGLAAVAAYHNSFDGPFIYDDIASIEENHTIRQLWPVWPALCPPGHGETVSGRPLLNVSLAINYAVGGLEVRGYHVTNLLIHLAAALLLFGVLRQTFLMPALRDRFGSAATPLALASALVWVIHPLQTEAVTYIVQRAELLMGLCYLLTLYCVVCGVSGSAGLRPAQGTAGETPALRWQGENAGGTPALREDRPSWPGCRFLWYAAAVLACLLGMASKEVMVTAPLLVFLYDRTFLAGSFAEALRRRWGLYVGLAATWGLLACLVLSTRLIVRQAELGAPDSWSYARTQPGVILHYLRLSVWPSPLCFEYPWSAANTVGEILPAAIVIGLLLAATVWGLMRQQPFGFLGAWFLLILAPTSSLLPLTALEHEHRMYLPLAALAVLLAAGGYALWDSLLPRPTAASRGATALHWAVPVAAWATILLALGYTTVARNRDYRTVFAIYQDTIDKCPHNPEAQAVIGNSLGAALAAAGRTNEAIEHYREVLRLKPDYAAAHYNLGNSLAAAGQTIEATECYQRALRLKPEYVEAHNNLGCALGILGRTDEAVEHYQEALRLKPDFAEAHNNLGLVLVRTGRIDEGLEHYHQALQCKPDYPEAHNSLANALTTMGQTGEAIGHYRQALRLRPDFAEAHSNLGYALAELARSDEAIEHYRQALRLKPDYAEARYNLAVALAAVGRGDEAIEHYEKLLRLKGDFAMAHHGLARVLAGVGRTKEAVEHYDRLLQLMPDFAAGLDELARLLATREPGEGGDPARAVQLAQRARELSGREDPRCLDTLAAAYAAAGRFDDAVIVAGRAVQLAESSGQAAWAKEIQARLQLYRAGQPYRQPQRPPEGGGRKAEH